MSLKHFHLVFIAASMTLFAFIAHWFRAQASLPGMLASAGGLAAATGYLGWFLRRYRALT